MLDARILADVYLAMTGGQTTLGLDVDSATQAANRQQEITQAKPSGPLPLFEPELQDIQANQEYVEFLASQCDKPAWQ